MQQHWGGPVPYAPPPPRPRPTSPVVIVVLLAVAIGLVAAAGGVTVWMLKRARVVAGPAWTDADSPVAVTSDDPIWGFRAAPVTVVVFGDFQDPDTASLMTTVKTLEATYTPSQLRVVWKNLPLGTHPNARSAAEASAGVRSVGGNDAFWHFADRALANQTSLSTSSYETWAGESHVDLKKLRAGGWDAKVDDDERLGHTVGVFVPAVTFVNGVRVEGAQPLPTYQRIVDDELTRAHLALASGVAADRVYVTRSKDNFSLAPAATVTVTASATTTVTATATIATPPPPADMHRVPIGTSPILGRRDALVTIVEFGDLQCPFCKRAETTLAALRVKYGADLRIVWKNEPLAFHKRALPAGELAYEARDEHGDAAFWTVHDAIYASSPSLEDGDLLRIALDHGINATNVARAISTSRHKALFDADIALAAKVGATGTPTFFVNGQRLQGAQPQATFESVIDERLTDARARVARGTRREDVYDAVMTDIIE